MKKIFILLFLFVPINTFAASMGENTEYGGYVKTEVWVRNNLNGKNQSLTMFKNTFDIAVEHRISDGWTFFFHPRYFYDAAYDLRDAEKFDRSQDVMGHVQGTHWLRDCYLDYTSPALDVRLGKQQVVWGQMDVPILDRVMPLDLTNWFLPDLADMRVPLWMAKVEYSPEVNSTLQALIIPDFEPSRVAPPGAPFAFKAYNDFYDLTQSLPLYLGPAGPLSSYLTAIHVKTHEPTTNPKNSTYGIRWRSMVGNVEYTLNWLYGFHSTAFLYSRGSTSTTVFPNLFIESFRERVHKRFQMAGFSFSKSFIEPGPLNGITMKGEFAYIHDEPTYYGTSGSREFTGFSDKYNWGLSFEKNIVTNWLVNFQVLQFIADKRSQQGYQILDSTTYGVMDKAETNYVLKVMTDFMHERLKPEITMVYQDDNQGRIVPKVFFEVQDNIWLTLGYAHFFGRPDSSNGEFRNNDQFMFEVKFTF